MITDVIFSKVKGKASSDLLRFIVSILLYTVSLTFVLKFALGWNLTALLTTSALLTAVIGFALQTTLGNLFAGVAIQLEQAFYMGDVIKIGDKYGRVETLRWRSMSIQTFDGTRLVIPNIIVQLWFFMACLLPPHSHALRGNVSGPPKNKFTLFS